MKIEVKDLGPIRSGTIDLSKRLIVFCGPNGTGKTYMSYLIYAITRLDNKNIGITLEDNKLKALLSENRTVLELDPDLLWDFKQKEIAAITSRLSNLFSISEERGKQLFKNTIVRDVGNSEDFKRVISKVSFIQSIRLYDFDFEINKPADSFNIEIKISENTPKGEHLKRFMEIAFVSRLFSLLAFYPITTSVIFPVERNSIYTFSKELSIKRNEALEHLEAISSKKNVDLIELYFKRSTRYPQPIRDILEVAEDLETIQKRSSSFIDFANEIEKELLKGKVVINKDTNGVEFVCDKAPRNKLSFHQSSSIVKTLASLVIYLKHEAKPNDLMLIDEPELNLHPDNQVKLARIFARMANKGLRLIISTHSDYIVREINNLLMLSSKKPEVDKIRDRYNYHEDEFLKPEETAAYFFDFKKTRKREANQADVKELAVESHGFEVPTIDDTISSQNEISEGLFYELNFGTPNE